MKLLIIWLKDFLKLDVKMNMIIKNMKYVELNTKITTAFLKTKTLNLIQQNKNVCVVTKIIKKGLMET